MLTLYPVASRNTIFVQKTVLTNYHHYFPIRHLHILFSVSAPYPHPKYVLQSQRHLTCFCLYHQMNRTEEKFRTGHNTLKFVSHLFLHMAVSFLLRKTCFYIAQPFPQAILLSDILLHTENFGTDLVSLSSILHMLFSYCHIPSLDRKNPLHFLPNR